MAIGIMVCFIDDCLWGGNNEFTQIIRKLKQSFHIKSEYTQIFDYIGIRLEQNKDFSIAIHQNEYIDSINGTKLETKPRENNQLTKEEITLLRKALGKINWVACMSRPEISYHVCQTNTRVRNATITDVHTINKVTKHIKNSPSHITIPKLDINSLEI